MDTNTKLYLAGNKIARPTHTANPLIAGIKDGWSNDEVRASMDGARERLIAGTRSNAVSHYESLGKEA
jgi:hypothetical protein